MAATNLGSTTTTKITNYPLNAWYVAAWDHEVTRTPMSRRILDRPLALYRTEDGKPVALADACWHRLAPLSMGKVVGKDGIQCPYHGIVYNSAGRCVSMPAQETINPSATVPSFPCVQRYRFVWVWLGEPALANPDTIPDMHQMDHPDWAGDGRLIHAECNYQLSIT
jgi:vanillate O-demethylase monooxygenase subunit